jgi:CP family cyanate transporter-like MFS transporter
MRAGLVLVGPLIPILKNYFNLSNSALSILAGLPILCFAATSLVMSKVAKLGSSNRIIKLALTALTIAMIGRATTGLIGLYFFALCMGLAIAVMNYELPAWVKEHAPNDSGYLTGVYVTIMGLAAAVSVAIRNRTIVLKYQFFGDLKHLRIRLLGP